MRLTGNDWFTGIHGKNSSMRIKMSTFNVDSGATLESLLLKLILVFNFLFNLYAVNLIDKGLCTRH